MFTKICIQLISIFSLSLFLALPAIATSKKMTKAADNVDSISQNQQAYFEPDIAPLDAKTGEETKGSLWVDSYSSHIYDNMYRAHRIGDTVTVVIDEKSKGSNKGDTKSDKKSEHTASIDALGGFMSKIAQVFQLIDPTKLLSGKTDSKFKADATTNRAGALSGKLTATVTRILKNGNMLLRGEQHLKINKEDQIFIVEGIIRPYDILPDNTVLSSSLADARISYTGFGVVADRQSPGWLVRVLDRIWPF